MKLKGKKNHHTPAHCSDQLPYSNLILKPCIYFVSRKIFFKNMLFKAFV